MSLLRRLGPALALALVLLMGVQRLDVIPCADETSAFVQASGGTHATESGGHGEDSTGHDCLCHISFVGTEIPPRLALQAALPVTWHAADPAAPPDVAASPVGPIPLG